MIALAWSSFRFSRTLRFAAPNIVQANSSFQTRDAQKYNRHSELRLTDPHSRTFHVLLQFFRLDALAHDTMSEDHESLSTEAVQVQVPRTMVLTSKPLLDTTPKMGLVSFSRILWKSTWTNHWFYDTRTSIGHSWITGSEARGVAKLLVYGLWSHSHCHSWLHKPLVKKYQNSRSLSFLTIIFGGFSVLLCRVQVTLKVSSGPSFRVIGTAPSCLIDIVTIRRPYQRSKELVAGSWFFLNLSSSLKCDSELLSQSTTWLKSCLGHKRMSWCNKSSSSSPSLIFRNFWA